MVYDSVEYEKLLESRGSLDDHEDSPAYRTDGSTVLRSRPAMYLTNSAFTRSPEGDL